MLKQNFKHILISPIFFLLAFFGKFCSAQSSVSMTSDTLQLSQKQNKQTSVFKSAEAKGKIIAIYFEDQSGSTGYSWTNKSKPSEVISFVKENLSPNKNLSMGAAREKCFTFKLTGNTGIATLFFTKQRPWEKTKSPVDSFEYKIEVN